MNIGIDIRSLMDRQYSGVNMYAFNLLNAIFNIDKKNEYILFYNSFKKSDVETRTNWKANNIRYHQCRIPNRILNASVTFLNLPKIDKMLVKSPLTPLWKRGKQKVDVFFSPNFLFSSFSNKCKKVITVHDLSFERCPNFYSLKGRLWHKFVRTRKMCEKADLIIAVSENTKYDIMELYGIKEEKIKVVYPGVTLSQPLIRRSARGQAIFQKGESNRKYILFLGTVENRKNVLGVVEAFKILNYKYGITNYDLVIAGGEKITNFKSQVSNLGLCDKVKILGYIDEKQKCELYKNTALFIYPSFYEGFGFPPLEAMANGVPVITGVTSSLPEVVGDAALMVDPYNVNDIASAMAQILTDEKLCSLMIERGFKRVRKFTWEKCAREVLAAVESL